MFQEQENTWATALKENFEKMGSDP